MLGGRLCKINKSRVQIRACGQPVNFKKILLLGVCPRRLGKFFHGIEKLASLFLFFLKKICIYKLKKKN